MEKKLSPVVSEEMTLPTALGTDQEQELWPVVLEQMLLPVAPEAEQEPSPMASEHMSLPACNGYKLLHVALE